MIRERFEESKETLANEVLDAIQSHFTKLDIRFDMDTFVRRNACFLDHVVSDAHFTGADVFPVDIPLRLVKGA